MRSFWLCKKASRLRALKCEVKRPKGRPPHIEFEVFTPEKRERSSVGNRHARQRDMPRLRKSSRVAIGCAHSFASNAAARM